MNIPYITVNQPIGTFYLTSIKASFLERITEVNIRTEGEGVQRRHKEARIREIATFCKEPNATFPTSIVVSVYPHMKGKIQINEHEFVISGNDVIGEILDGQHRLEGLKASGAIDDFELPVVLMFDMTSEDNAYVFTTINSKQTKINPSHIVDLQEYSTTRSPYRTAHIIAKAMNTMDGSAFRGRLKMLGFSEEGQFNATLSQGTFASQLVTLISSNPEKDARDIKNNIALIDDNKYPLRQYFIDKDDNVILKIMLNCFNALDKVFHDESKDANKNVLWKTTGFSAIIRSFPELYRLGERKKDLSESFFISVFSKVRRYMQEHNIALTGANFGGGGKQVQKNLTQWIVSATQNV